MPRGLSHCPWGLAGQCTRRMQGSHAHWSGTAAGMAGGAPEPASCLGSSSTCLLLHACNATAEQPRISFPTCIREFMRACARALLSFSNCTG